MAVYLQELIPHRKYDRWDYVRALRALLPRGKLWIIPLPDEKNIEPYGIGSAEEFGRATLTGNNVIITPNGIASVEGFGLPSIVVDYLILMSGIASAEAWGTPTLVLGFMQYCDFEVDLCSGWDSEFTTNWSQTTEDGEGIAQRASDGTDRLYPPSGTDLTGDFLVEWSFWRSSSEAGNISIHMEIHDSGGIIADAVYNSGSIGGINGGSFSAPSGPAAQRMRIERVSGTIWCYRWTGSAWEREDSWSTPGSSVSDSDDIFIKVNGANGVNGIGYIGINGTLT